MDKNSDFSDNENEGLTNFSEIDFRALSLGHVPETWFFTRYFLETRGSHKNVMEWLLNLDLCSIDYLCKIFKITCDEQLDDVVSDEAADFLVFTNCAFFWQNPKIKEISEEKSKDNLNLMGFYAITFRLIKRGFVEIVNYADKDVFAENIEFSKTIDFI